MLIPRCPSKQCWSLLVQILRIKNTVALLRHHRDYYLLGQGYIWAIFGKHISPSQLPHYFERDGKKCIDYTSRFATSYKCFISIQKMTECANHVYKTYFVHKPWFVQRHTGKLRTENLSLLLFNEGRRRSKCSDSKPATEYSSHITCDSLLALAISDVHLVGHNLLHTQAFSSH